MDIKNRIEVAKANLQKAQQARIVAETQKEAAQKQLEEIVAQMTAEGVTPDNITAEIDQLEAQIETHLTKAEGLMPRL